MFIQFLVYFVNFLFQAMMLAIVGRALLSWFPIREGNPFRPFCSRRCKLIDLGKWAAEEYHVPVETPSEEPSSNEEADDTGEP